ncbi:hypothetical protein M6C35_003460 [Vibrio metschnikovii]|nr:hypothetical protein [Vibrio metschnikovii]
MKRYYLLIALLAYSSWSFSASCPVGDKPTLTWPLGTSKIYSACVNGCLAVEGFGGTNTWVCDNNLGYCTGYFETNGQSCDPDDGGDGSCPDNNCNDGSDRPHFEYADIKFKPLTPPPSVISEKNFGLAQALKFNSDVNVNQTQHLRVEIRDQTARLQEQSRNVVRNIVEQTDATKAVARNSADMYREIERLSSTAFSLSQKVQSSHNQDKAHYEETSVYQSRQLNHNDTLVNRVDTTNQNLNNIKQTLDNNFSTFMNFFARKMDSLESAISGSSGGGGDVTIDGLTQLVSQAIQANQMLLNQQTDSLNASISKVNDNLDALANLDMSDVSVCKGGECPEGFYTSKYENGFAGVFDDNFESLKNSVIEGVTEVFGSIDLSNAVAPSFCLIIGSFGSFCFTDYINLDWIFTFVRSALMFTTIFYSRKLMIGG